MNVDFPNDSAFINSQQRIPFLHSLLHVGLSSGRVPVLKESVAAGAAAGGLLLPPLTHFNAWLTRNTNHFIYSLLGHVCSCLFLGAGEGLLEFAEVFK